MQMNRDRPKFTFSKGFGAIVCVLFFTACSIDNRDLTPITRFMSTPETNVLVRTTIEPSSGKILPQALAPVADTATPLTVLVSNPTQTSLPAVTEPTPAATFPQETATSQPLAPASSSTPLPTTTQSVTLDPTQTVVNTSPLASPTTPLTLTEVITPLLETDVTTVPSTPAAEAETPTPTIPLGESGTPDVQIIIRQTEMLIGQTVSIPIHVQPINETLGSITLSLSYDPTIVRLDACQIGALSGVCNPNSNGIISLAALNASGQDGNILLGTLTFVGVQSGNAELEIDQVVTLSNILGEKIEYLSQVGDVTVP